jgi:hypothetical protein
MCEIASTMCLLSGGSSSSSAIIITESSISSNVRLDTKKDVEQELSKLESQTAVILQKVKKAHENGDAGICLTRVERNKLRKFLFIMKYRGPEKISL